MNGRDMFGIDESLFAQRRALPRFYRDPTSYLLASSERERESSTGRTYLLWSTSVTLLLPTMAKGGEFGLGRARKERAEDIRMIRGTMVMNYVLNIHGMQIAYRVPPMSTRIALQDTPEWRGAGETSAHRSSSH